MGRTITASDESTGRRMLPGTLTYRAHDTSAVITNFLADCWSEPFENVVPIRATLAFKGQRNFAGLWWFSTTKRHVGFESWCERDQLMHLDFSRSVVGVSSQPFRLAMPTSLPQQTHVPDYFVRHIDGSASVIDVRPDERIKPADQEIFDATAELCANVGWNYERLGYLPPSYRTNLYWIAGYRHSRCHRIETSDVVRRLLDVEGFLSLGQLMSRVDDPVVVLPTIFHMIWLQEIDVDLVSEILNWNTLMRLDKQP